MSARQFDKGDRVNTPDGPAEVAYRRMRAPDYCTVDCYSVRLLAQWKDPCYSGTIYPAESVSAVEEPVLCSVVWVTEQDNSVHAIRGPEVTPCIDCGSTLHRTGQYRCPEVNKYDRDE